MTSHELAKFLLTCDDCPIVIQGYTLAQVACEVAKLDANGVHLSHDATRQGTRGIEAYSRILAPEINVINLM